MAKLTIIRNFLAKLAAGRTDDGIMITLPNPKTIDLQESVMMDLLLSNGVDPRLIKSEEQLKNILNQLEAVNKQKLQAESGIRNTRSAKVFDLEGKQIPQGSRIMGGKATETEAEIAERLTKGNKQSVQKLKMQKMLDDAIEDASPGFANDVKVDAELVAENLAERMGKVYDDLPTKERLDLYDQAYTGLSKQRFKNMRKPDDDPEDLATGGRVGLKNGLEVLSLDDRGFSIKPKKRTIIIDGVEYEIPIDKGFNRIPEPNPDAVPPVPMPTYPREDRADGGRIGLKAGMSRRAFLKLMGSVGAGVGAAKTGLLKILGKGTEVSAPAIEKTAEAAGSPPPYFFKLVDKIKTMGDDVTERSATKEREAVTEYKDYRLTEDLATGEKTIQRIKLNSDFDYYDETLAEDVYMNYKPGKGQTDEAAGKVADEYTEDTSYLRTSGPQKGEGTMFEDNMTEFGKTKKASGGIARMLGE